MAIRLYKSSIRAQYFAVLGHFFPGLLSSCYKDRKASAAVAAKSACKVTQTALILSKSFIFICAHVLYLVWSEKPSCNANGQSETLCKCSSAACEGSSSWPGFASPLQMSSPCLTHLPERGLSPAQTHAMHRKAQPMPRFFQFHISVPF